MYKFNLGSSINQYVTDRGGQFAVWFGVAAFPILVATSMALDFRSTEANSNSIKRALDVAVLASVSNDSVTETGKKDLAVDVFNTHYAGAIDLDLTVDVSDGRVEMNAKGVNSATLSRAIGNKGFPVNETSVAEMIRANTICVMALANEGKEKLRFLGNTKFNSPTCSVQSNSRDPEGILSASRNTPIAKAFCSAGGATGTFKPAARGECRVIDDPYTDREVPESGICMPDSAFMSDDANSTDVDTASTGPLFYGHGPDVKISYRSRDNWHRHRHCHTPQQLVGNNKARCHTRFHPPTEHTHPPTLSRLESLGVSNSEMRRLQADYGNLASLIVPESENYVDNNKVLYPGTYCGGLTLSGSNVTFMPGIYIIKDGPLTFKNGASVFADEVSLVLKGESTVMTVESGSFVNIKAPKDGPMAGMAIYQDRDGDASNSGLAPRMARSMSVRSSGSGSGPAPSGNGSNMPTGINLISSGGELNVTGTMYFPTQALDVLGKGVLGAKAPATSFIAHQVTFADDSQAAVAVNTVQGDIPPMLPLSDDGARLVE